MVHYTVISPNKCLHNESYTAQHVLYGPGTHDYKTGLQIGHVCWLCIGDKQTGEEDHLGQCMNVCTPVQQSLNKPIMPSLHS